MPGMDIAPLALVVLLAYALLIALALTIWSTLSYFAQSGDSRKMEGDHHDRGNSRVRAASSRGSAKEAPQQDSGRTVRFERDTKRVGGLPRETGGSGSDRGRVVVDEIGRRGQPMTDETTRNEPPAKELGQLVRERRRQKEPPGESRSRRSDGDEDPFERFLRAGSVDRDRE